MQTIRKVLGLHIGSDLLVGQFGQVASYVVAIGFFVLAVRKIATLQLTEAQLFFGVLMMLAVFLLIIGLGTLARIEAELTKKNDPRAKEPLT